MDFLFLRKCTNERDEGTINGFAGVEKDAELGLGVAGSITVKFLKNVKKPQILTIHIHTQLKKKLAKKKWIRHLKH